MAGLITASLTAQGCESKPAEEKANNPMKPARPNHERFYRTLFAPLEERVGPIDRGTLAAIVGFDAGGPLSFATIGRGRGTPFVTYVSCELAVHPDQKPNESGRYEFLITCDDESWVRTIVSAIGRMSFDEPFGHLHTVDVGAWVKASDSIQGVAFEKFSEMEIEGKHFNVLRCIGITRSEMEYAQEYGAAALIGKLKDAKVYPRTETHRKSIL